MTTTWPEGFVKKIPSVPVMLEVMALWSAARLEVPVPKRPLPMAMSIENPDTVLSLAKATMSPEELPMFGIVEANAGIVIGPNVVGRVWGVPAPRSH